MKAAAISPLECPLTAIRNMPQERRSNTSAIWMAVVAGWLTFALLIILELLSLDILSDLVS